MPKGMQSIYTTDVSASGGAASITFNNIPQTYTDLYISLSLRCTAASWQNIRYSINNDGTSIYSTTSLYSDGSSAAAERLSGSGIFGADYSTGGIPNSSSTAGTFGNITIYIPNYTSNIFKQAVIECGSENISASTFIRNSFGASLTRSASPVTRFDFFPTSGNLAQYSSATLYGIGR